MGMHATYIIMLLYLNRYINIVFWYQRVVRKKNPARRGRSTVERLNYYSHVGKTLLF